MYVYKSTNMEFAENRSKHHYFSSRKNLHLSHQNPQHCKPFLEQSFGVTFSVLKFDFFPSKFQMPKIVGIFVTRVKG